MRNAEVIRQWQILREIESSRTGVTIHDLADLVDVTTRTIRRDLQALQEAGFSLFDEGGEHDTKRWKLNAHPFRSLEAGLGVADVAALYLSRSIVEALSAWPLADELRTALAKLEGALNPRMRDFLATLPQVLSTKAAPGAGGARRESVDVTRRLFEAVQDRRVIVMRYFSAASQRAKSYSVEPYRLALTQGGVYLVAWVPQYDQFRTFAVERIEKLSVQETTFRRTRTLPADVFGSSLGVFSAEPEHIEIEFAARVAPYVQGRTWHDSQSVSVDTDGRVRLTMEVSNDWALRSWLLGFGADVRVIAPASLARTLRDELRRAADQYARSIPQSPGA
ncbi:MAG: WYL domain-containing protein [Acidobacteria bacterium]|jgi:predicted DNA-binding transcriptional regulator YafY|nr:WYL domain-containing protein [Acidobacteriota bacterium]